MKRRLPFVIVFSCALLNSGRHLYAQSEGVIHGVVTAKADGSALPNAAIRLDGANITGFLETMTGADGHFVFQRLIPGQYTLVASRADFQEQRIQFTLKPREVQSVTLALWTLSTTVLFRSRRRTTFL